MDEYEIRISHRARNWQDFPWRVEVFRHDGSLADSTICCFHGGAVRWARRAIRKDLRYLENLEKKSRGTEVIKVQIR